MLLYTIYLQKGDKIIDDDDDFQNFYGNHIYVNFVFKGANTSVSDCVSVFMNTA